MIPNLERLELQYCTRLLEVHQSVGSLRSLVVLNLNNCEHLVQFPSNVCGLKSLQILNLHGCSKLDRLPLNLGEMEHLEELDVAGTAIRQLPDVCGLKSVKILNLHGCSKLDRLPFNLGEMERLEELNVGGTAIRQVPSSIVQLTKLRTWSIRGCKGGPPETWSSYLISRLLPTRKPDCMGLLLPPLAGLSSLQTLDLNDCNLVEGAIPGDIGSLYSLRELNIGGNNFVSLPDTISQLSELKIFCLEKCHRLQSLPKLPPGLIFVGAEECTSLKTISSVLELTSPDIALHFFNCFNLVEPRGRNNNNLAIMLLKHWLQIDDMSNHDPISQELPHHSQFHIRLPGSEIPNLFNCQSEGSEICGRLPDGWLDDEFMGFAVCAVFSPPDHSDGVHIVCSIDATYGGFNFGFSYPAFSTNKSDHLWLAYLSRRQVYSENAFPSGDVIAGFFISGQTEPLLKRCGIRPLYKQDVEYLEDLSATDVGMSMVQDLGMDSKLTGVKIPLSYVLEFSRLRDRYGIYKFQNLNYGSFYMSRIDEKR